MNTRQTNALVLFGVLALGAVLFWIMGRGESSDRRATSRDRDDRAIAAIPADAFLVATVDVHGLRATPLSASLAPILARVGAMADAPKECGFDPLERIATIVLAIPEGGESGDFGLAMQGDVARDDLATCAKKVVAARGGDAQIVTEGDWTIVEDRAVTAPLARRLAGGRLALHDGGPFLLGRGAWLGAMREASEGKRAAIDTNERHAELRKALGSGLVVATAILPASVRDRVKNEMAGETNAAMNGVLGVSAAGFAIATDGANVELRAELRCDDAAACDEVRALVERKRAAAQKDLGLRLVGLGALLDAALIEVKGTSLSARASLPVDDAKRILERVLASRGASTPPAPAVTGTGTVRDAGLDARIDEVVRVRKDAGRP